MLTVHWLGRTAREWLPITALIMVGCGEQVTSRVDGSGKPAAVKEPEAWTGTVSVDPAGDLARLQGLWRYVPHRNEGDKWAEQTVCAEGSVITFDYPGIRQPDNWKDADIYEFIINSSLSPKVLKCNKRIGNNDPLPGFGAPRAFWYKIDNDQLILWTSYWDIDKNQGEVSPLTYRKVVE